ncbi:MAG: VanW family protein [Candidatus Peribacteraceae bacterium]|jgi:vancomycin resistance protein YoaR
MRRLLFLIIPLLLITGKASAAEPTLTFRHRHFLYTVRPTAAWRTTRAVWTVNGKEISPPSSLLVDGDSIPPLPPGVVLTQQDDWDRGAIRQALAMQVAEPLRRDPGSVVIRRTGTGSATGSGTIVFEGVGLPGREVDLDRAMDLTVAALENGVREIMLPVKETQPQIRVEDPLLRQQGITEVVTVGESDYSNSPANRRHNIAVGLSKFNGHLVPPGKTFSFGETLGRVDGTTGYLKELVIKGARTEPDYGGGLCQVSTTAYRGIWEYGFPIAKRINHSYTVSHYFPQGTDATVYPPAVDMQFVNDSSGALLIQTHREGNLAYFIYYGTRDARRSTVLGPFIWDRKAPPPDRTEYTTELPPGERKKLGERVPGLKALWVRVVSRNGEVKQEPVYSFYEARPLYTLIGVEKLQFGTGTGTEIPTVFMEDTEVTSAE